jgi:hypothetical protein
MAPVTTTVQVERSADEVFAYATDPTRFREWQQGVVDGRNCLDPHHPAILELWLAQMPPRRA